LRFSILAIGLCACVDSSAGGEVTALFTVPRGGALAADADFFAMPFPSDFWRDANGLDLSLYPRPSPIIEDYLDVIPSRMDGFGTNAAIFFRFDGAIDASKLPATPEAARADDASVYLVDVQADSPTRGERWPVKLRFEPRAGETIGTNWLSVLPYPGFPMRPKHTYAVVVTTRLDVRASDDWLAVSGASVPDDLDLARAQAAAQPLLDWLDEAGGDERADVASAAVFTTQDATSIMPAVRARVWALPAPTIRDVVDVGPGNGWERFDGVFDAPNFQTGDVPYFTTGGEIVLDETDGMAVVQRTEALRVAYTIPDGTMPANGWPVAIYAHGTGGSYQSFINDGTATRLAAQGIAVISIDQVLHGPRNPGASPETSFFNFINPLAARDNALQGAADDFSVVRLVQNNDLFDPDKIYFFGHSQGGLTGPPFLAFEPEVKGAVLSGAGALLYLAMLTKTQPVDVTAIVAAAVRDEPLDEFNPTLALLQTWIERSDPANYGPLLVREPAAHPDTGAPMAPKPIFQSEGLVDSYAPPATIEALAVAIGVDPVAPVLQDVPGLALRGRTVLQAPVTGNLDGTTAVLLQYEQSAGSDGHFVVFDVAAAETQSAAFLGTLAATGEATLVTP
jgi:dienelactone hydrolase